ncbi:uncharacterized protein EDB91DRAFT_1087152 [Suillus paluster]|uniref:uncharacterized protein n=1 Tax=Suillus paluster TaxID=48578 RepID=UPI001B878372|nr:uncharacterized protein EDB91DRAFT_1087152 [Suillus paluster]KAG1725343.1 hypothetical protein EDB91DRAFT_1087152 [Suillus paluster]
MFTSRSVIFALLIFLAGANACTQCPATVGGNKVSSATEVGDMIACASPFPANMVAMASEPRYESNRGFVVSVFRNFDEQPPGRREMSSVVGRMNISTSGNCRHISGGLMSLLAQDGSVHARRTQCYMYIGFNPSDPHLQLLCGIFEEGCWLEAG